MLHPSERGVRPGYVRRIGTTGATGRIASRPVTRSPRLRKPLAAAVLGAAALVAATLLSTPAVAAPARPAADDRPTAVVALGDSVSSGEGAGDYEPGTRGENGDYCHRSPNAYVNRLGLADEVVNLSCSGADSSNVAFGGATRYGEGSQAQRLVEVAQRLRVTTIVVQLGANDDAALVDSLGACIRAYVLVFEPSCRTTLEPLLAQRMAATATKVEAALGDVRTAMRRAGYADDDYQLILPSYSSAVTERMVGGAQNLIGCPYRIKDAAWGRTVLFPALSATLGGVAERTGARFLDMSRAAEGFEACSQRNSGQEWQRRLTVSAEALTHGGLDAFGIHLFQESFHPSAAGHAAFAPCVAEFARGEQAAAACVPVDGRVTLQAEALTPAA
jgi:lysophospholipase L1-like esterase